MIGLGVSIPQVAVRAKGAGASIAPATAALALSLRKIISTYNGPALRVRRSSDNSEQDIGFVGNGLDTAALLSFVGSGDGFVATWYDQSPAARHATQATALSQPIIVLAGVISTMAGKPAVEGTASQFLSVPDGALFLLPSYLINAICRSRGSAAGGIIGSGNYGTTGGANAFQVNTATSLLNFWWSADLAAGSFPTQNVDMILRATWRGTGQLRQIALNGTVRAQDTPSVTPVHPGNNVTVMWTRGTAYLDGWLSELITSTVPTAEDIATLEQNQSAYYGITLA